MNKLVAFGRDLLRNDEGLAMVEYTILLALIAIATIVTIGLVGDKVANAWANLNGKLTGANFTAPAGG